jgi:hypothetical protein
LVAGFFGRWSVRGHAAAHGLAARHEREIGRELASPGDGGADGRLEQRRRVGTPAAGLDVGELVAQRRDAAGGQRQRDPLHEPVPHPGPGAMGEDIQRPGVVGPQEDA